MDLIDSHRILHRVVLGLLMLSLATFSGCGNSESPQPATTTVVQTASKETAAAITETPSVGETPAPESDPATTPEQVSEIDDGVESITDTPPTTTIAPVLKLAAATSEPKAVPSPFKEGVHYQRLAPTQPTQISAGKVEVVEIFWYGCSHCFALDPKLENWRAKNKPSYVVFQRIPGAINDVALFHGRVFYTAELLGKLDELHKPIFDEIHLNGNPLNTMGKAKAFFTSHGVAAAEFDKIFASFTLESRLQNANMLMRRYRVTGVPFFVVNGKFTTDVSSAGGEEQLLQLLNELAAREHVN